MSKIILSADSTCDLGDELKKKYNVNYYPFHIILGDNEYQDNVDITPDDLFQVYRQRRLLPKTGAIGAGEYEAYFKKWVEQGYEVVHLNLGSAISSAYQNCCIAAQSLGHVYPVDSGNLSTGTGLLVIEAAKRIMQGMSAQQIQQDLIAIKHKVHASFVLDTLEFMHAGGRCSMVAALGANLLKLKPCIEVNNVDASMTVGRKYRGDLDKVLLQYIRDKLQNCSDLDLSKAFIVHSGISRERIALVYHEAKRIAGFRNLYITRASCTISCHCGPNTLGIMFMSN